MLHDSKGKVLRVSNSNPRLTNFYNICGNINNTDLLTIRNSVSNDIDLYFKKNLGSSVFFRAAYIIPKNIFGTKYQVLYNCLSSIYTNNIIAKKKFNEIMGFFVREAIINSNKDYFCKYNNRYIYNEI